MLHPIEHISESISRAGDRRVYLEHQQHALGNGAATGNKPLEVRDAVLHALAEPLDFPPLAVATVPGDRVAIALDDAVPQAASVVRGAVAAFQQAGIETDAISIVTTDADTSRRCREKFTDSADAPHFVVHDPDDEKQLCLVGTTKRHEPLLVNRTIFDADVVLPIGVARLGGCGAYESLFPRFSNAETLDRYRTPTNLASAKCAGDQARETDEAGWLIGAPLVIQIVPGGGETVAQVLAGDPHSVTRRGEELYRERWSLHSPQRVSLVIATVTGGSQMQNWQNIARALAAADNLLNDSGAVAICSNLEQPPGPSLGRLIGSTDLAKTEHKILHDHGEDSWPAWQLARALQRGPVYLLSQLPAETVEEMGLAPVDDLDDIVRLAGRHESFALVEDSQHAVITVAGEDNE